MHTPKQLDRFAKIWGLMCLLSSSSLSTATTKDIVANFFQSQKISDTKPQYTPKTDTPQDTINFADRYHRNNPKNMESLVFDDSVWISVFKEWIGYNSFIEPIIIKRSVYNTYKGDILVKEYTGKKILTYKLYIPDSMKFSELPAIIKRVNQEIYAKNLPKSSATIGYKKELLATIWYLSRIKTDENRQAVDNALKKYLTLWEQSFPWEKPNYQKVMMEKEYLQVLESIQDNSEILTTIEDVFTQTTYRHLLESVFEMGANMLGNIPEVKKWIALQDMKNQLKAAKNSWNKIIIAKKQKQIINIVLKNINTFYTNHEDDERKTEFQLSLPSEVIKSNMANCVSLAIIGHQILQDIWIDHDLRLIIGHVALSMKLADGKEYYFDPRHTTQIQELKVTRKIGKSEEILVNNDKILTTKEDPESILMGSLLFNKAQSIGYGSDRYKKIKYLEPALLIENGQNPIVWYILANVYLSNGEFHKALFTINKALKLAVDRSEFWYTKQEILWKLEIFDERYTQTQEMMDTYK